MMFLMPEKHQFTNEKMPFSCDSCGLTKSVECHNLTQGTSDWKEKITVELVAQINRQDDGLPFDIPKILAFIERVRVEAVAEKVAEVREILRNKAENSSIGMAVSTVVIDEILNLPSLSGRPDQE